MTKNLCFVKCGFFFYIKELSIKQTSKRRRRRSRDTKENGRRMDGIQISEITKRTGRHFKKKSFLLLRLSRWRSAFTFDSLQSIEKPFFWLEKVSLFIRYQISLVGRFAITHLNSAAPGVSVYGVRQ